MGPAAVRERTDGKPQDIQDGEAYMELSKPGGFLAVPGHTGLIVLRRRAAIQVFNLADPVECYDSSARH